MSNLTKRLLTAGVGIPLLYLALFTYEGIAVPAVLLVLVVLLLWECSALLQIKGVVTRVIYAGIGGAAFIFVITISRETFLLVFGQAPFFNIYVLLLTLFIAWVTLSNAMGEFWASRRKKESPQYPSTITLRISSVSRTARILLTVGCLLVLVSLCISFYGLNAYIGPWILIYVLAIAWVTDTGAYFAGRTFGKKPLAKRISPNKTVEGTIGGCVLGWVLALIIGFWWLQPAFGWSTFGVILVSIVIPIAAVCGDLFESVLKRISEAKESGSILPGHGGLLDRIDSLILAAPFVLVISNLFGYVTL